MKHLFYIFCFCVAVTSNAFGDSMVHKFKSPSFNGVGYSAHALTIENQEFSRQKAAKEKKAVEREHFKAEPRRSGRSGKKLWSERN